MKYDEETARRLRSQLQGSGKLTNLANFAARILGLVSALFSVVVGIVISLLAGRIVGWSVQLLPGGIALALSSSPVVGVSSGVFPAQRASRLNLVDSLRFQ